VGESYAQRCREKKSASSVIALLAKCAGLKTRNIGFTRFCKARNRQSFDHLVGARQAA